MHFFNIFYRCGARFALLKYIEPLTYIQQLCGDMRFNENSMRNVISRILSRGGGVLSDMK